MLGTFAACVIIGVVEALLAVSFAALVFGGRLISSLDDGIGLYLGAAAITLAFVAWRAGSRGVVGGVQEATAGSSLHMDVLRSSPVGGIALAVTTL